MEQVKIEQKETSQKTDDYSRLPGPKTLPFMGLGLKLKKKGCQLLTDLEQNFGPMVKFPLPGIKGVLVNDHEAIQTILRQTERHYYKGKLYDLVRPITGVGLVNNQGSSWRARRRTLNPIFKEGSFDLEKNFQSILEPLKENLLKQKNEDHSLLFSNATFKMLFHLFFSNKQDSGFENLSTSFTQIQDYLGTIFWSLIRLPLWVPTSQNRKTNLALKNIHLHVYKVLENSKKNHDSSLVKQLRLAKDPETGKSLTDRNIVDEIITFFIAGHDTTALTLTYTFFLLAKNKKALKEVQKEIDGLKSITLESLKNCSYLKATIFESMRLLPAVYMINRSNKDWVTLGGYDFAPHTTFFTSQYAVHRSKKYWKNPEEFEPSRFLNNPKPEGFFPFGDGPRTCLGNHLALAETLLFVGSILKDLEPTKATETISLSANLTSTPRNLISISWTKR